MYFKIANDAAQVSKRGISSLTGRRQSLEISGSLIVVRRLSQPIIFFNCYANFQAVGVAQLSPSYDPDPPWEVLSMDHDIRTWGIVVSRNFNSHRTKSLNTNPGKVSLHDPSVSNAPTTRPRRPLLGRKSRQRIRQSQKRKTPQAPSRPQKTPNAGLP